MTLQRQIDNLTVSICQTSSVSMFDCWPGITGDQVCHLRQMQAVQRLDLVVGAAGHNLVSKYT